jgi:hypothetical protein
MTISTKCENQWRKLAARRKWLAENEESGIGVSGNLASIWRNNENGIENVIEMKAKISAMAAIAK